MRRHVTTIAAPQRKKTAILDRAFGARCAASAQPTRRSSSSTIGYATLTICQGPRAIAPEFARIGLERQERIITPAEIDAPQRAAEVHPRRVERGAPTPLALSETQLGVAVAARFDRRHDDLAGRRSRPVARRRRAPRRRPRPRRMPAAERRSRAPRRSRRGSSSRWSRSENSARCGPGTCAPGVARPGPAGPGRSRRSARESQPTARNTVSASGSATVLRLRTASTSATPRFATVSASPPAPTSVAKLRCGTAPIGNSAGRGAPNESGAGAIGRSTISNADSTSKRCGANGARTVQAQPVVACRVVDRERDVDAIESRRESQLERDRQRDAARRARVARRRELARNAQPSPRCAAPPRPRSRRAIRTRDALQAIDHDAVRHRIEVVLVAAIAFRDERERVVDAQRVRLRTQRHATRSVAPRRATPRSRSRRRRRRATRRRVAPPTSPRPRRGDRRAGRGRAARP